MMSAHADHGNNRNRRSAQDGKSAESRSGPESGPESRSQPEYPESGSGPAEGPEQEPPGPEPGPEPRRREPAGAGQQSQPPRLLSRTGNRYRSGKGARRLPSVRSGAAVL